MRMSFRVCDWGIGIEREISSFSGRGKSEGDGDGFFLGLRYESSGSSIDFSGIGNWNLR